MPANVLLIDDNDHQHEIFRCYAMMSDDVELSHATGLQEAADIISEEEPDFILLDNRLRPHRDFRETVPLVRGTGYSGKIVLISSDVDHPIFLEAPNFSVHSCIDKAEFRLDNFQAKMTEIASSAI